MTRMEKIHTLLEEDKDAMVGSYLSLLAFIENHKKLHPHTKELLNEITKITHRHIEMLPENSVPIFKELFHNEQERIESEIQEVRNARS